MTPEERKEWNDRISSYRKAVTDIRIPPNVEPGQAKDILSKLDAIYAEVRILYGDVYKRMKEVENLVYRLENKNKTGGNEGVRRNNMITAVENAPRGDGTTVNLYDIQNEVVGQFQDISAILDILKAKSSMCITINGLLKVESIFS